MMKFCCTILLALVATFAKGAAAENLNVDGVSLTIRTLPGYCDSSDPNVLLQLPNSQKTSQWGQRWISISVPCDELTAFLNGTKQLQKFVLWGVATTEGGTVYRLQSMTRSEFATEMGKMRKKNISEINKQIQGRELISAGLIDRESDAVYEAFLTNVTMNDGSSQKIALVVGFAAIKQLVVQASAYDRFIGTETFSELLASVKLLVRGALSDNTD